MNDRPAHASGVTATDIDAPGAAATKGETTGAAAVDGAVRADVPGAESASAQRSHLPPEIRLGQDIARGLAHLPEHDAAEQIATHLRKFWEPRMRRALVQRVRKGDPGVDPLLALAVRLYILGDIDRHEVSKPSGG